MASSTWRVSSIVPVQAQDQHATVFEIALTGKKGMRLAAKDQLPRLAGVSMQILDDAVVTTFPQVTEHSSMHPWFLICVL